MNKSIRINDAITAPQLRVIGENGEQLGIISRAEAMQAAANAGLDLVEISPAADPPVAKVIDWGKYQYQKMKEQQKNKRKAKTTEIKQMRMGLKIGKGDLEIKLRKIREFLADGDKVKILIFFRGREMAHQELGFKMMNEIIESLSESATTEGSPALAGRNLSIVVRAR